MVQQLSKHIRIENIVRRRTPRPIKCDLKVDCSAFDRVIQVGGYVSASTGEAPEANNIPISHATAEAAFDAAACIGCGRRPDGVSKTDTFHRRCDGVWLRSFTKRTRFGMHLVSLGAPERQFVDFCALRALFDLCWDCTLWVPLTADRERRARLGVNDGNHLPSKAAKKLVIGLIPVCRQLTQFFELGLGQFNNDVKPNIRVTRPSKVASRVNVSGGHVQGRQFLWCGSGDQACNRERAPKMKRIGFWALYRASPN